MRLGIVLIIALWAHHASAFEATGNTVADTFLRAVEMAGFAQARAGAVRREGKATVLDAISAGDGQGQPRLTIAKATIEDAVVNADNQLLSPSIVYGKIELTDAEQTPTATIGAVALTEVRLGGEADAQRVASLLGEFKTIEVADLTARSASGERISVGRIALEITSADIASVASGVVAVDDVGLDLSLFDDPTAREIKALGIDALSVDLAATGRWEAATGRGELSQSRISVDGLGAIEVDAAASGLTAEAFEALRNNRAVETQMLDVVGSVLLGHVRLRFIDAGLTDRLLTRASERSGVDRTALIARLTDMSSEALDVLGNSEFTEEAVRAVEGFLSSPGRLTISAAPANEVSVLQLVGAAMLSPKLLPDLLALKVSSQ